MSLGRELVIAKSNGAGGYDAICVTEQRSLSINNELIDITKPNCASPGSRLVSMMHYGLQKMSFSGSGAFVNQAAVKDFIADAVNQVTNEYQIDVPGVGTFTGDALIATTDFSGDKTNELQKSFSCEMSGNVTFVAAT